MKRKYEHFLIFFRKISKILVHTPFRKNLLTLVNDYLIFFLDFNTNVSKCPKTYERECFERVKIPSDEEDS